VSLPAGSDGAPQGLEGGQPAGVQRLDKWLWFARLTKSRTLAAQLIESGKVRINRAKAVKPSQTVKIGDVLTLAIRGGVEVVRVLSPGARRGPAPEARCLYEILSSTHGRLKAEADMGKRDPGSGRPTKRERRLTDQLKDQDE
jgi:ribosome-associated heat shock protein Hsp15